MKKKSLLLLFPILILLSGCERLRDYKMVAKDEINTFTQNWKHIFSSEELVSVNSIADSGKEAIDLANDKAAINTIVADTKTNIDGILSYDQFSLTVIAESNTLEKGQNKKIEILLTNITEKDIEINYFITPFLPFIPNWQNPVSMFELPEYPETITLKSDESYKENWYLGEDLEKGKHDLRFECKFYSQWIYHENINNVQITMWSHHINLEIN